MKTEINNEVNVEVDKSEQLYSRVRIPLWGLFFFAVFTTLYFAHAIFIPILLALLASFLLAPAVLYLQKFHIPSSVSALLVLAMLTFSDGDRHQLPGGAGRHLDGQGTVGTA